MDDASEENLIRYFDLLIEVGRSIGEEFDSGVSKAETATPYLIQDGQHIIL